jgi:F0F1-type ATP synthase assembly protein I
MTPIRPPDASGSEEPDAAPGDPGTQDPWAAFGYFVAGVLLYGGIGFVLDRWLDTSFLLPVGILFGVLVAMYMVFARYRFRGTSTSDDLSKAQGDGCARPRGQQADDDDEESST